MRMVACCALVMACLSCAVTQSSTPPLADPPADTAAPVGPLDVPWPTSAPPAVKAVFAGSWELREPLGFDETWFDEAGMQALPDTRLAGRRRWRGVTSQGSRMLVDAQISDRAGPAIAYTWWLLTWNEIVGPPQADLPAVIHFRHCGRVRVWLDGQLLFDEPATEDGSWHTMQRAVLLTDSDDVFLVKSGRGGPELGQTADFELCVSTTDGQAFPGQIWQTVRVW